MALNAHVYRCSLLAVLATILVLCGMQWQWPGLIATGLAWFMVMPWLYRRGIKRRRDWILAGLILCVVGSFGFAIGFLGVLAACFKLLTCIASLALAGYFLRTLIPPHTALITAIGEASRGPLGPQLRTYTRAITWFWGLFLLLFGVMSLGHLVSLLPATALAWLPAWQLPLSIALFVGEFYLRKRLFPAHNHPGFWEYLTIVASAMAHPPRTR